MSVVVRSTTVLPNDSADTIVIPSNTQPGDVMLLAASVWNVDPTTVPAGWTLGKALAGTGSYTDYQRVLTKIAVPSDAGASVTLPLDNVNYGGLILVVCVAGVIDSIGGAATNGAASIHTGTVAVTKTSTGIVFASMFTGDSSVPTFTPPSELTALGTIASASFHRSSVYKTTADVAPGTAPDLTIAASGSAASGGSGIVVYLSQSTLSGQLWPKGIRIA